MVGLRTKMVDGNHAYSYVEQTAGDDEWAEVISADLAKVMAALPKYARANAKWHCSPACRSGTFDRLAMAAGGNTARDIGSGATPRYAGYPIEEWAAMPSDDTSGFDGVIMLFFGDYSMAATLGTRRGITIKVSNDRYLEYDQIGIQATERFCIVNHDVGESATRGPVVGMLGNA
jgi:HK97 family phage major capsid protein